MTMSTNQTTLQTRRMLRLIRGLAIVAALALMSTNAFANEAFVAITGSVGVFRSDLRIFNPSRTKSIQVQAFFLPAGNVNNSAVKSTTITVPQRQMTVYNDVVSSLFHTSGLGGIRFISSDNFVVTERIYATSSTACGGGINPCTLGQFLTAVDSNAALKHGVLLQLNSPTGTIPTSRTNVGVLNPASAIANITWRVYDRRNALVGSPKSMSIQPYAVISPAEIKSFGVSIPENADLSDAWVSFSSDRPVVAYASVVDNGSTDPTYIPATVDTDPIPATTPPATLNLNGTFSGKDTHGPMTLVLTQTGTSLSGYGTAALPSPHSEVRFIVTGTVSGSSVTLAMRSNGGCYYDFLGETVTLATNDRIEGSFYAPLTCTGNHAEEHFVVTR